MAKLLIAPTGKHFFVKEISKPFHSQFGYIKPEDLAKEEATTNTGVLFKIIEPGFSDFYDRLSRGAQIIPLKDMGSIITRTGIGKDSVVLDAGTGSGALACLLAYLCKTVVSYDIREDHLATARKNKEYLRLANLTLKQKDIRQGFDEENEADLVCLDLPDPWEAVVAAEKALKRGGFLVSYSPTIPQTADFVNKVLTMPSLLHLQTIEIIEREWEVDGRKVRPRTQQIGHSGFLSFVRRV
ncbi:methyltransferase domain-containing protein [Candidatus Woesearchaeota archaeon]|nr:methyltransferase domain-containing protein [Candidatus Woesearchaeota archaeon]